MSSEEKEMLEEYIIQSLLQASNDLSRLGYCTQNLQASITELQDQIQKAREE